MSKDTIYGFDYVAPTQITREEYVDVGSGKFQLGTAARGFKGLTDFEIWDAAVDGTQLTEDVDYELDDIDQAHTVLSGFNIYTRIRILNATYQTGSIFITYKIVLSYNDPAFANTLFTDRIPLTYLDTDNTLTANSDTKVASQKATKYYVDNKMASLTIKETAVNYTILDDDGYNLISVDTSDRRVTITLPLAANNTGRMIYIKQSVGKGGVIIDGNGAETIDGAASIYLFSLYNFVQLFCDGTAWLIIIKKSHMRKGWGNRTDYSNVHIGTQLVTVADTTGYIIGEIVTEETSGNTGIVHAIISSTQMYLIHVTGTGVFTTAKDLTGATSSTLSEQSASTLNVDSNFYHGYGKYIPELKVRVLFGDGTDANTKEVLWISYNTSTQGYMMYPVDANSFKLQTGYNGYDILQDADGIAALGTDAYCDVIVEAL
jgi:hypothetical protein